MEMRRTYVFSEPILRNKLVCKNLRNERILSSLVIEKWIKEAETKEFSRIND